MNFKIVTGAEGSGKTKQIFRDLIESSIKHPDRMHIVITPEQNTLAAERRLLDMHPDKVLLNIDVVSFNRLVYRLYEAADLPKPVTVSEIGKSMLLRRCALQVQKDLKVYSKNVSQSGFYPRLDSVISEMFSYGISPETLENASQDFYPQFLGAKLHDIALIYRRFSESLGENRIVKEDLLQKGLGLLHTSGYFDGSYVVLDGFTGFTPVQYGFISEILKKAASITVSLSVTSDENLYGAIEKHELFAIIKETFRNLQLIAQENGIKTDHVVFPDEPEVDRAAEIKHLCARFLRPGKIEKLPVRDKSAIRVLSCLNTEEEAEFVATEIKRLIKTEGLKYRDFAVVTGALSDNEAIIASVFNKYNISYFLDNTKNITDNPLSLFVLSAFDAVRSGFTYKSVMRFFRCGLCPVPADSIDILDNYILALGIRGRKKWSEPFTVTSYKSVKNIDIDFINGTALSCISGLLAFSDAVAEAKIGSEYAAALRKLLLNYSVENTLLSLAADAEKARVNEAASVYRQLYSKILEMIEEFEKLFAEDKISRKMFFDIISAGVESLAVTTIPGSIDEVQIGDVVRSRREYTKVLFIMNFNEGVVPPAQGDGGFFSDEDREKLSGRDIVLAPATDKKYFEKQYYVYQLISAPTKHLYFTYSRLGSDGKDVYVSPYLPRLAELFEGLDIRRFDSGYISSFNEGNQYLSYLADRLGDENVDIDISVIKQIYSSLISSALSEKTRRIADAAFFEYVEKTLGPDTVGTLLGREFYSSVSGLETQADCPFKFFLNYTLRIRKRDEFEFSPFDRGNYFHKAFELLFKDIIDSGSGIKDIPEEQVKEMLSASLEEAERELSEKSPGFAETGVGRYIISRWKKIIETASGYIIDGMSKDSYEPARTEMNFGPEDADCLSVDLEDGRKLKMTGKIDRVDKMTQGDDIFIKIADYKTYGAELKDDKIDSGTQLQLLEYMNAVTEIEKKANPGKNIKKGAAVYINVSDNFSGKTDPEKFYAPSGFSVKEDISNRSGIKSESELEDYCKKAADNIKQLGQDISAGKIGISPIDDNSCKFCDYRDICRFDETIKGYSYRKNKNNG